MDELFLLPPVPVAIPRSYWLPEYEPVKVSSQIVVIQPSKKEFARVERAIAAAGRSDYDMEIINTLYKDSALILPHRPYDLLTQVFHWTNHSAYLGDPDEVWDPEAVLKEAKFLHFSNWPIPKVGINLNLLRFWPRRLQYVSHGSSQIRLSLTRRSPLVKSTQVQIGEQTAEAGTYG